MSYTATHARAAATVARKGAAVTFVSSVGGVYDPATDTESVPVTVTVTGSAVRVAGDPERYRALNLSAAEAPALLFTPDTYGTLPPLGAEVTWGGVAYTVRDVDPLAPDGTAIAATVVIAR